MPLGGTITPCGLGCPQTRQAEIECLNIMFTEETVEEVLAGAPDYVLDAIDNIDTKVRKRMCNSL
jgi:tRNA A37 threonylcarbamoyladenosine dehydratase